MTALSARGITARYPGQASAASALAEINLSLEPGERLLLLGPNGAGKSTFIRVFSGLMRPSHGDALIEGAPVRDVRDRVGVVTHATFLYDELTVAENLRLYAALYQVPRPSDRAQALIEQVGLARQASVQVGRLSRGQQQRVTIARALLHEPSVLLLDEPDTGLDVAAFRLVEELVTAPHRTVVVTTHNLASGLRLATRVGVLSRGRLVHELTSVSPSDTPALSALLERLAGE